MGKSITRRTILAVGGASAVTLLAKCLHAQSTTPLRIRNRNTGEAYEIPLYSGSGKNPQALQVLDWLMRDHREGQAIQMDRRLFDILYVFQRLAGHGSWVDLTSGYRTARTNQTLRRTNENVALNSYHMYGMAADFVVAGMEPLRAAQIAWSIGFGGVGLYSTWTHVDTGPIRKWGMPF